MRSSVFALALFALGCAPSATVVDPAAAEAGESRRGTVAPQGELADAVADWAREVLDAGSVAGLSVAVEHNGELLVADGYGAADLELDVPASATTVYRIGSLTKQFTAAAVMQLVEAGDVQLDAPIQQYVDFPTGEHVVTVEHLLNHTSGIKSYTGLGAEWRRTIPLALTHDELLGMVRDEPFDFAPGEEYRYNNSGYYLLGVLIENVSGDSYADYVETRFAQPLGLSRTTYCDEKRILPGRAEGYETSDDGLVNDDPISMTQPFAAGALCSTVGDLLVWQRALESGEVVSAESYRRMTTAGRTNDGEPFNYGYGLGVGEYEGHRRIAHSGGINGFVTILARFPDDDLRIAVLTNTAVPVASQISTRIARHVLGMGPEPEPERP